MTRHRRPNILIVMSDEHARRVAGCYGDDIVKTPNIDRLAAQCIVFDAAYTPSPICVPARAALATGRPIHETGHWDNAHPYDGTPRGWMHVLSEAGFTVESVGKLHFRDNEADTGFSHQSVPMHVVDGIGDVSGSIRNPPPLRPGSRKLAEKIGPGESDYTHYDRQVRDAAIARLKTASEDGEDGLVLFVSFVAPHFPLIAPQEFYDLYTDAEIVPREVVPGESANHPWLKTLRSSYAYDNFDEAKVRKALRSYYGLVSFLDDNIGSVLQALDSSNLSDNTSVLYFSDHGDNLGERGMWGKSTFFEESAGVPLMMRPAAYFTPKRVSTPVCLTDIYPTVLDLVGLDNNNSSGHISLKKIAAEETFSQRAVFSQYHAAGSPSAGYMVRRGRYKYIHYVGFAPQLFDLELDPHETQDLGTSSTHKDILTAMKTELYRFVDPEQINGQALQAQAKLVATHGGVEQINKAASTFSGTPAPQNLAST